MKRSLLVALFSSLLFAGSMQAATDYLLELDGIKGESADERHKDSIEILSFSWGASQDAATAGTAGKVSFQDFHFTTRVSKASPQLLVACATGKPIPKAKLFVRKSGTEQRQDYLVITLENVLVSSLKQSGPSAPGTDTTPNEEVALYFDKATIDHTAEDGTVTTGTAIRTPTAAQ